MIQRQGQVTDEYSRPVPGAEIYVFQGDVAATLTSDGTTPLAQPVETDEFGNYSYYVEAGEYREDTHFAGKLRFREVVAIGSLVVTQAADGIAVNNRSLLAAIASPVAGQAATLTEPGREGMFVFSTADLSAEVTADPTQRNYVAPSSDTTGASGAWVRKQDSELLSTRGAALVAGTSPAGETVPLQRHIVRNYLEDISGFVEGASGVAADNATALNAALASGGVHYNMRPGALYKIAQILPKSNTALVFEGSNKPTIYMPAANFTRADNTFATRYGTDAVGILAQGLTSGLYTPLTDIILANFILQSEVADNRNITGICGRNVERMLIDGVEVFGLPLGAGINLQSAVDCEIRNPYVHDMITDTTDATLIANSPNVTGILVGSDEVNSIACDNVRIINPTIHDVTTGSNFRTANGADQSDGINLVGQSNGAFVVEGYDIRNTGEGIDCSASHSRFSDGYISDTSIFGMKFIHGAKLNTVNGLVIIRAGLAGLSFYGTDIAGAGDTANNRASGVTISDIDPNISWAASDTSAVLFADNVGTAGKPKNNLVDSPIINIGANGNYGVLDTSTGSGNSAPNPTITTGAATAKRVHAPNNACTFPQSRYGAVKVIGSGDQAITTSALTAVQWTGEAFDPHGQHDNSTNPERLNATVRGIYEITGLVRFNANTIGSRYAQLYLSGAAVAGTYVTNDASASREVTLPIQATVLLEANDYIEVRVYQDSGGNLNLERGSSFLSMKLVREA